MGMISKLGYVRWASLGLAFVLLASCAPSKTQATAPAGTGTARPRILVSISTFVSFARAVAGDRADVSTLVPVGASPEDYQPTPADIEKIHTADILVENGLGLETWLARTIDNAKNDRLAIVVATDGLPVRAGNPHLWMDPVLAKGYVRAIARALVAHDPAGKTAYERNAAAYVKRLTKLRSEIAARVATIPPRSRSMIVFHNAWQYYDDRFGLRTIGAIEMSPGQEPNPRYIADLIGLARRNNVRAVFAEPEYNPKLVRTLAQSAGIATVENLYDDSIGSDHRVTDYESMLRYDTATIVAALGGRTR
ncbi:MAG: iron/manganese ABC transporter substrate-binding protein YfeA [Vulcanimicrobiaceae bacterium]